MEFYQLLEAAKLSGFPRAENVFQNSLDVIKHFHIEKQLTIHNGCVNTVQWDPSGNYLLTGSDDRCLKLTDPFRYENADVNNVDHSSGIQLSISTSDTILSAKFLPYPNDSLIASCTRKGAVFVHHVHDLGASLPSSLSEAVHMHDKCCVDVLPLPQQPSAFLSLSLDRKLCLFDVRCAKQQQVRPQCLWTFRRALTAAAVHPHRPHELALANADGIVRVVDLRSMTALPSSSGAAAVEDGGAAGAQSSHIVAYCHPRGMHFCHQMDASSLGHDFRYITGLAYHTVNGQTLLAVSHMFRGIFLFDTDGTEMELDEEVHWETAMWNNPTIQVQNNWENTGPLSSLEQSPLTRSFLRFTSAYRVQEVMRRTFLPEKDDATKAELFGANRYKQIGALRGHRNSQTVIKDPVFFGSKYLMSGSECGHVFIWNWHTERLEHVLLADDRVVNRVRPHPTMPILATSGLAHSVKTWTPNWNESEDVVNDEKLQQILSHNASMTHEGINLRLGEFVHLLLTLSHSSRNRRLEPTADSPQ